MNKSDHKALAQCGCQNNVILSGIPASLLDDTLRESVISVVTDIDVYVEHQVIEVCHRFDKADRQKPKKINVLFLNRKSCE